MLVLFRQDTPIFLKDKMAAKKITNFITAKKTVLGTKTTKIIRQFLDCTQFLLRSINSNVKPLFHPMQVSQLPNDRIGSWSQKDLTYSCAGNTSVWRPCYVELHHSERVQTKRFDGDVNHPAVGKFTQYQINLFCAFRSFLTVLWCENVPRVVVRVGKLGEQSRCNTYEFYLKLFQIET